MRIILLALLTSLSFRAFSQTTIAKWTFDAVTLSSMNGPSPLVVGTATADLGAQTSISNFTGSHNNASTAWTTPVGNGSAKAFSSNNWSVNDFYQFRISTAGYEKISVSFDHGSSATGPKDFKLQYSTNGSSYTDVSNYSVTVNASSSWNATTPVASSFSFNLNSITELNNALLTYFRIADISTTSLNGGTVAAAGTSRIDNFTVTGTPTLSINDVSLAEGNLVNTIFNFTVQLAAPSTNTVTVNYTTADGTANSTTDYTATSGTITFAPNQTSQTISVPVAGDVLFELAETFFVNLSSPTNATISDGQGQGTITNDDPLPAISINDVSLPEGNSGAVNFDFTVQLSGPSGFTVTVNYSTADGTAGTGDYTAANGTLSFAPGETSKTITVPVSGDGSAEPDEAFLVNLSNPVNAMIIDGQGQGTITNDDAPAVTTYYVDDNSNGNDVYTPAATGSDANPGTQTAPFATIQHAVNTAPAGSTIYVDAGTYQEQVIIPKSLNIIGAGRSGTSTTKILSPATLAPQTSASGSGHYPIVMAKGLGNTINIKQVLIDGNGNGNSVSSGDFYGVYYDEASGTFEDSRITAVRNTPLDGMQTGNAFFANHAYDVNVAQTVTIQNNIIDDYQKTGILINEWNTQAIITGNTITGAGPLTNIAQNGVQLGFGAYGTITGNTIANNNYIDPTNTYEASGIILFGVGVNNTGAATGNTTTVSGNTLSGNGTGLLTAGDNSFGYSSNKGVTEGPNSYANNDVHVWLEDVGAPGTNPAPNSSNVYDKRVDNTSQANVVYGKIQEAINYASAGNTLNASAGTFNENVTVNKALTLNGANANVSCSGTRAAESIINGTVAGNSAAVTASANSVTVNGFTLSNPLGSYGISANGFSNMQVLHNIITNVGNNTSGMGASYGVYFEVGSTATSANVTISNNCISNIRGGTNTSLTGTPARTNNGSGGGILVGSSTAAVDVSGVQITNNKISNIRASTMPFTDGGKGAYGVLINVGANPSFAGKAISPQVVANEINDLQGHWAHGIGLEGETPGASVTNNAISNLVDTKGNTDAVGVLLEQNDGASTVLINNNSFTNMPIGVKNQMTPTVNAECNWYGSSNAATVAGKNQGNVDYTPFLTNGTDDQPGVTGFQPVAGACNGPIIITRYYVDDNSNTGDVYTPGATGNDANAGTAAAPFATIAKAMSVAAAGDTVYVDAGTYVEKITATKQLVFLGANEAINPCAGTRNAETIIMPPTSQPYYDGTTEVRMMEVQASNVIVRGFTFDGDNPSLTTNTIDAADGIDMYAAVQGITIENNIFKNINEGGINAIPPSGAAMTQNVINNNSFDNIPGNPGGSGYPYSGYGIGVYRANDFYATVDNNCMTNVRIGIQSDNFYLANTGATPASISNNTIQSKRLGIWYNNNYAGASTVTINNNIITTAPGSTNNEGLALTSIQSGVSVNVNNNNVTGANIGISLWNNPTTSTVAINGGTLSNCNVGVFATNYDDIYANGASSAYLLKQLNIQNPADAGVVIQDDPLNTNNATVTLTLNNSFISGGGDGVRLNGADVTGIINNNSITGSTDKFVDAAAYTGATAVNAECNWYGTTNQATIAAKMAGNVDFIPYLTSGTDDQPATPGFQPAAGSCNGPLPMTRYYVNDNSTTGDVYTSSAGNDATGDGTTAAPFATITKAISVAAAGDSIYVDAGTFNEDVYVNKTLLVKGAGEALTILRGTYAGGNNGSAATLYLVANNATVKNLTVTRDYGTTLSDWQNSGKNQGISVAANDVTVDSVTVRDQRNAVWAPQTLNFRLLNSTVRDSRTGVHLGNDVSGLQIKNNNIINNFTHGILFNFDFGPLKMTNVQINDNNISGNWYSQINMQAPSTGANLSDMTGLSMSCNWYGTTSPAYNPTPGGEPGYTAQTPSQFGGTDPGVNQDIQGRNAAYAPYIPFLTNGTDNSPAPGFQPVPGSCGGPTEWYVDDNSNSGDVYTTTATGSDVTGNGTQGAPFATITKALSVAANGHTIYVDAGTYNESVVVNKSVLIKGSQPGVLAKGRSGAESIIDPNAATANGFKIVTDNVTIDGFTITNSAAYPAATSERYGVVTIDKVGTGNFTGIVVKNNIVTRQFKAVNFNYTNNFEISRNWLHGENDPYNYGCMWVASYGTSSTNGTITNNDLDGYSSAVEIQGNGTQPVSNITVSENRSTGSQYVFFGLQNSSVYRNSVLNVTTGSHVYIGGGCTNSTFSENFFDNGTSNGIRIENVFGAGINSNLTITNNSITGHNTPARYEINVDAAGYSGILSAECNWFGTANAAVIATKVQGPVDYIPFLTNGTDDQPSTPGFQPVPGSCNGVPVITYYPRTSATDLSQVSNWTDDPTGVGGSSPANFTSPNQVFNVNGNVAKPNVLSAWTISGGSNLILNNIDSLIFRPSASLTIGSGSSADFNGKQVTLKSTAAGTAFIGQITGSLTGATNVTVERYLTSNNNRAYRLLTPSVNTTSNIRANWQEGTNNAPTPFVNFNPVAGYGTHITGSTTGANGFDATQTGQGSLLTYNGITQQYQFISNTNVNTLQAKTGYLLFIRGDRSIDLNSTANPLPSTNTTLRTTGSLLTGTQTYNGVLGNNGFNLITNPYASPINWTSMYNSNTGIMPSYTLWDPNVGTQGGYVTVNTIGIKSNMNSNATTDIQSGQAFFVQASGALPPTVNVEESHKSTSNNTDVFRVGTQTEMFSSSLFYKNSNGVRINADGVTSVYNNLYSAAIDVFDATQIPNWEEDIAINRNNSLLSIESRPLIDIEDTIPFTMARMQVRNYEWQFATSGFNAPFLSAVLIDNFQNTRTPISMTGTTVIPFSVTSNAASSAPNRFMVVFNQASNTPLPVNLLSARAYQKEKNIQVEWTTGQEANVEKYEVEESADARQFSKAHTATALGSTTNNQYNWLDVNVVNGANYYRIKAIGKNGEVQYSKVLKVDMGKLANDLTVYPNPVKGNNFTVSLNLPKGVYHFTLTNKLGQQVLQKQVAHTGGTATQTVQLPPQLAQGAYQFSVAGDGVMLVKQLIKE